eukprot:SAG11_NODE_682_length_7769_cov_45.167275_7_plen_43_part_00
MYSVVELAEDDTGEGGDGLALGKLSVGQIEKGRKFCTGSSAY